MSTCAKFVIPMALIGLLPAAPAAADTTFFNTGDPDGRMATATRPESAGGKFEIEFGRRLHSRHDIPQSPARPSPAC